MTIVMGLDQHRAQITAEWVDTEVVRRTRSLRQESELPLVPLWRGSKPLVELLA